MKNFLMGLALVGVLAVGLSACNCLKKTQVVREEITTTTPTAPHVDVPPHVEGPSAPDTK